MTTKKRRPIATSDFYAFIVMACCAYSPTVAFCSPAGDAGDALHTESLTAISDKSGDGFPSHADYSFGSLDITDTTQLSADMDETLKIDAKGVYIDGYKHIFVLRNDTKKAIIIQEFRASCYCIDAAAKVNDVFHGFPCTVQPGAIVNVMVALNIDHFRPNTNRMTLELIGKSPNRTVAQLTIEADLNSGINFAPKSGEFGFVPAGTAKSVRFTLTLSQHIPQNIPPGETLQLGSTNPYLKVSTDPPTQQEQGVVAKHDNIVLPDEFTVLHKPFVVNYRVDLSPSAPLGPIGGHLELIDPHLPLLMILKDSKLYFSGEVIGHMTADHPFGLVLDTSQPATANRVKIVCTPPVTPANLRVSASEKYLLARLVPSSVTAPNSAGDTSTKVGLSSDLSNMAVLEVSLDPTTPPGNHDGKVIITDTINAERIELPVFASLRKR